MKKLKNIVKTFLFTMCVIGMFSMNVYATAEDAEMMEASGEWWDLTWELKNGVLTISGEGDMVSTHYEGYPWYEYRSEVDSIIIEEGVTSIGSWAFRYNAAKSVTIPDGVSNILYYAFSGCYNLEEVNLPDNINYILTGAFSDCLVLTDTTLQNMLTKVKAIDAGAFSGCNSLTKVHIPANITYIGEGAFELCQYIQMISIDPANEYYYVDGNVLFDKEKKTLLFCPAYGRAGVYTVPDSVSKIGKNAFSCCGYIDSIIIPDSVTEIGNGAFSYCTGLSAVNISDNVTEIGEQTFISCRYLKTIELPSNLTTIGYDAFYGTGITNIKVPKTVTTIEDRALGYTFDYSNGYGAVKNSEYIIRGYAGTAAEEYAINNDITFVDLTNVNSTLEVNLSLPGLSDTDDEVVVKLIGGAGETVTTVSGEDTSCQFSDISAGAYTLEVSKKNYVTRTYTVNVGSESIQQDVELQLMGDITGDGTINARDKKLIYNHMAGTSTLTDYIFLVGDVTNDGIINARDKKLIYNHIAGASSLWE